ncbi:MAG TPA: hypothetical protein VGC36_03285 [Rhizomicrobium sp.]
MSAWIYLLTLCLPLATVLLVFGMKYVSAAVQARSRARSEDTYRVLAAQAAAVQAETAASLASARTDLAEIKSRLVAIETILKAVE